MRSERNQHADTTGYCGVYESITTTGDQCTLLQRQYCLTNVIAAQQLDLLRGAAEDTTTPQSFCTAQVVLNFVIDVVGQTENANVAELISNCNSTIIHRSSRRHISWVGIISEYNKLILSLPVSDPMTRF